MPSSHLDSVPTPHSGHGSHLKSPSLPFCPLRPSASDVILTLGLNVVWREEGKMGDTGPILHRRNRKGGAGALLGPKPPHAARPHRRAMLPVPPQTPAPRRSREACLVCPGLPPFAFLFFPVKVPNLIWSVRPLSTILRFLSCSSAAAMLEDEVQRKVDFPLPPHE